MATRYICDMCCKSSSDNGWLTSINQQDQFKFALNFLRGNKIEEVCPSCKSALIECAVIADKAVSDIKIKTFESKFHLAHLMLQTEAQHTSPEAPSKEITKASLIFEGDEK